MTSPKLTPQYSGRKSLPFWRQVNSIPRIKCPACGGTGTTGEVKVRPKTGGTKTTLKLCDVCIGTGVIHEVFRLACHLQSVEALVLSYLRCRETSP